MNINISLLALWLMLGFGTFAGTVEKKDSNGFRIIWIVVCLAIWPTVFIEKILRGYAK